MGWMCRHIKLIRYGLAGFGRTYRWGLGVRITVQHETA